MSPGNSSFCTSVFGENSVRKLFVCPGDEFTGALVVDYASPDGASKLECWNWTLASAASFVSLNTFRTGSGTPFRATYATIPTMRTSSNTPITMPGKEEETHDKVNRNDSLNHGLHTQPEQIGVLAEVTTVLDITE